MQLLEILKLFWTNLFCWALIYTYLNVNCVFQVLIATSFVSSIVNQLHLLAPGIWILNPSEVMLLGSPLTTDLNCVLFVLLLPCRLEILFVAIPKLLYLLWTSPS